MTKRNKRPSVLSLGYCTLDVIRRHGRISHRAGGTAANVAANLAYLGWEANFAGRLGSDTVGRRILDDLRRGKVSTGLVQRDETVESPVIVHEVVSSRHSFLFRCPDCGRPFPRHRPVSEMHATELLNEAGSVDVFFFDRASAPALRLATELQERGTIVVFEPSAPGVAARTLAAAEAAHILKCSHERREQMDGRVLLPREGQLQIETLGARGLRFRQGTGRWTTVPALKVEPVDAGGAGDWLTAALLVELAREFPGGIDRKALEDVLRRAQAVAALSCLYVGARTMAKLPRARVEKAASRLLAGELPQLPEVSPGRASRAHASCSTCLR